MKSPARLATAAALGAVTAAGAAAGGLYYYVLRRSLPRIRGDFTVDGLKGPVEIVRDRWGVPHIFAADERDVLFGLGFVHAQDRLWQMDFYRRLFSGTLAEVVGEPGIQIDRLMRRFGLRRFAAAQLDQVDAETMAAIEAYTAGVNAFLGTAGGRLPLEFLILRYRPQPWAVADSVAFGKFMGWMLASGWATQIARSELMARLGPEALSELEPLYPEGGLLTVPPGTEYRRGDAQLLGQYQELAKLAEPGGGSNNWVVDGEKSVTGKPLLANDPHLTAQMPSIWYEAHLCADDIDVVGASIAGLPTIIIGHNRRIAWGVTNSMTGQQDLYIEQVNPEKPDQYKYKGRWRKGELLREEIAVKGREPIIEEVLITSHGPVISPAIEGETRVLSVRGVPGESVNLMRAGFRLIRAQNWDEFRDALRDWSAPGQNFVYADVDGNIGYQLAARLPVRRKGRGLVPVPGWTDEYDWDGYVPFEGLPSAFNPPTHFAATANNKTVGDDYPHPIEGDWADEYRIGRIVEMLRERDKHAIADFQRMHGDVYSTPGREMAEFLGRLQPEDEESRRALEYVRDWDYHLTPDSVAGTIVEVFFYHMYRNTFAPKLGDALDRYMGQGVHYLAPVTGYGHKVSSHLARLLREAPADWFPSRNGRRDSWEDVGLRSLRDALDELRSRLGPNMSRWQWGRVHTISFPHMLGRGPLARLLSRGPYPMGGDHNTVAQAAYDPMAPYAAGLSVPSYRQIVDLANLANSVSMHTTGQSGQPGNRHFADMIGPWRRVEYHPMLFEREAILTQSEGTLVLRPRGEGA
jgi:penicillin amidase